MNMPGQRSSHVSGQMSGPLTEILAQGPVPIDKVARWGAQLARELAGAHEVGRIHGNVRAEVVSVGLDGAARLAGFNEPSARPVAHPAPELARGGVPTRAADVFALGAVLYAAGGGAEPRLMPLWTAMGHPDPARRPSASEVADRLDRLGRSKHRVPRKALLVIGVVVVVVAGVLAGFAFFTGSRPLTRQTSASPPEWKDPIVNLDTVDPCGILDTNAMQRFGATRLFPDANTFTTCTMEIQSSVSDRVIVTALLNNPSGDDRDLAGVPTQRVGALSLYLPEPYTSDNSRTVCHRTLLFPNRFRIALLASVPIANNRNDLCAVADAAVQVAERALYTTTLPRRNVTAPPNSLFRVDACTLVDEAALRAIPGLDPNRRERPQGIWSCVWGEDPRVADPPAVSIFMGYGPETTGQPTTIGGRAGTVDSNYWEGNRVCRLSLTQRSYQGVYDRPRTELLFVLVHLNAAAPPDAQCAAATTIAEAAAARLPPPS